LFLITIYFITAKLITDVVNKYHGRVVLEMNGSLATSLFLTPKIGKCFCFAGTISGR